MSDAIRVLIVDDEDRFRATTTVILTKRGFQVKAVGSGAEAIEEVGRAAFDVVVLDVQMPGMGGNEALRKIKDVAPNVAVLMLTGHGTPESIRDSLRDGISDYLTKPCPVDLLAQKIREACVLKGGVREQEPRVRHIMLPLASFGAIREDQTVDDAIEVILRGFAQTLSTSALRETLHRSILVHDRNDRVVGIMTFTDLLRGLQPPYMRLLTDRPAMADTLFLGSPGYSGMFTIMARDLASKTVRDIIPDTPPLIDADANLMEAVARLLDLNLRRLLVTESEEIVGVIREQDLFFEMANVITQHGEHNEG